MRHLSRPHSARRPFINTSNNNNSNIYFVTTNNMDTDVLFVLQRTLQSRGSVNYRFSSRAQPIMLEFFGLCERNLISNLQ